MSVDFDFSYQGNRVQIGESTFGLIPGKQEFRLWLDTVKDTNGSYVSLTLELPADTVPAEIDAVQLGGSRLFLLVCSQSCLYAPVVAGEVIIERFNMSNPSVFDIQGSMNITFEAALLPGEQYTWSGTFNIRAPSATAEEIQDACERSERLRNSKKP